MKKLKIAVIVLSLICSILLLKICLDSNNERFPQVYCISVDYTYIQDQRGWYTDYYVMADEEAYIDIEPPKTAAYNIADLELIGEYSGTNYPLFNYYPVATYVNENENYSFRLDDKGMLVNYLDSKKSIASDEISKSECEKLAKDFISEIVDISEYTISVSEKERLYFDKDKEVMGYTISFEKYVNDVLTADSATISIRCDGTIYNFDSIQLGRIDVNSDISKIDIPNTLKVIHQQMEFVYQNSYNYYHTIEYETIDSFIIKLKDGSLGMYYCVEVTAINSDYEKANQTVFLVVKY